MNNKESADELFHFTKEYRSIISIMNNKFKPFFCIEDLSFMYKKDKNMTLALPIVCFCDIPLERISIHKKKYGNYGIGLTKEWGMKNSLNIVNYSFPESYKSSSYRILIDSYDEFKTDLNGENLDAFSNAFNILLMTSKPYEGKIFDKMNKKWLDSKVRFYNEREWRYLPLVDKLNWSISLEEHKGKYCDFFDAIEKEQPKIQDEYTLKFTVDDIKYIFLTDNSEIEKFIKDISGIYGVTELQKIRNLIRIGKCTI